MATAQLPPGPTEAKAIQAYKLGAGIFEYLDECYEKYGETFTIKLPGLDPQVWVANPDMVEDIFKLKPPQYDQSKLPFPIDAGDDALVFINNEFHQETRKIIVPPFSGSPLKKRIPMMHKIISNRLDGLVLGEEYDMRHLISDIMLDIIVYTLLDELDTERFHLYHKKLLQWIETSSSDAMFALGTLYGPGNFRSMLNRSYKRLLNNTNSRIDNLLPWAKSVKLKAEVAELIREDIRKARSNPDAAGEGVLARTALLCWSDGELLSEEKVISEVNTMLIAGHETSASTGVWYMMHMLTRPDVAQKVKDNVMQSVKDNNGFDPHKIIADPYINACFQEAQRLTPSTVGSMRHLNQDTQIGNLYLPAKTNVLATNYIIHRREDIWGHDAKQFKPERWMGDNPCTPSMFEYFPFGGGRRVCMGSQHAKSQLRILFAEFARRVEFTSKYDEHNNQFPRSQQIAGQTSPQGGLLVKVAKVRPESYGIPHPYNNNTPQPSPLAAVS
ncbi:MAG: cytochrome P450 [Pseudomonadales bacterium]|nr:cytochrome P450 [Pseudomonadales bacterium]